MHMVRTSGPTLSKCGSQPVFCEIKNLNMLTAEVPSILDSSFLKSSSEISCPSMVEFNLTVS